LRGSSLNVIICTRQSAVAQELDKIHVLHVSKFCRPTSGVGILEQRRYSASIDCVSVYIRRSV